MTWIVNVLFVHVLPVVIDNGILPLAVVVVRHCPIAEVETCVVSLAVELVALADRTAVGYPPAFATDDGVGCAVLVGYLQLHEQLRQAVVGGVVDAAPFKVVGVVAHGGEPASLKGYPHGVQDVFADKVGHVVGVEIDMPCIV